MKMLTRWLLVLVLPALMATTALAAGYTEGKEYTALANPQPTSSGDKIEIVELFWYGCPHCYRLDPVVDQWVANKPDDVEFVRMPAIVGPPALGIARKGLLHGGIPWRNGYDASCPV